MKQLSLLIILFMLSYSCQMPNAKSGTTPPKDMSGIKCKVEAIKGITDKVSQFNVMIEVFPETGKIKGFGGCNQFFGQCEANVETGALHINSISSTKKACKGKAMQVDRIVQYNVRRLTSFAFKDDYVLFYQKDVLFFSGKRN